MREVEGFAETFFAAHRYTRGAGDMDQPASGGSRFSRMEKTPPAGPAQAVQDKQQQDAKALFERLQQIKLTDLTMHSTLEHSARVFDFVAQLLACSYSRYGRRTHHPRLMIKVWLAMLAVGCLHAANVLRAVDDSLQLRLFLQVMSHEQLPLERQIKGFAGGDWRHVEGRDEGFRREV